ncbi:hypothetical protein BpOF4_03740 [Alkalihalophilus pseudofirmus OF4]|uniref:Uncharacterized protein n=1 Tax=Alkalihalophilus pseudofirmus (strain ATCC BAA-2126 / JCM 17055 / OF4) TaxID=398511 RepID=D3FX59_ALKPO|nr:DUF6530 family protein [Alkalihalophilus pseudofirmus]ADC48814.1 hypothetical protein BpOF4_03740 [Alkalihalophilus pseudofirmus OF4]
MEAPRHLAHKPVYTIDNYNQKDGKNNPDTTDAQALTIGNAQWNDDEISAKVWRHTTGDESTGKWSRQSEELPLHRLIDLNILLANVLADLQGETVVSEDVKLLNLNKRKLVKGFIEGNKDILYPRLNELRRLLNEIKLP